MANDPSDTLHLLERLRGGDRQAPDLFQHYRDRLRRMVELRLDARLQGRVDASDVLQDAFIDAATRLDGYLRGSELPAFLWLRLIVSERLSIYHRRHLGTKMRDAGQEVSLYRNRLAPGQLRRPGLDAAWPAHIPLARRDPGRASAPGPGGAQRARPPGPGSGRAATLRGAQPRRDGAGPGDHRGSRGEAVHPGPQAAQGDPGGNAGWLGGPLIHVRRRRGTDDLLDRLAEEFAARFRRGEQPSLKEYTDRYPELADDIRELFPALVEVEQVKVICHDWDEAEQADATTPPPSQVGDYRIIREIGHGGMGVVYEAEQVSLGRRVALKVLPWQVAKDRTTLARFRREARASARLHHTNIVPVFEVGQDGEVRYYAMQFIQGQSLDAVIDELRRLRSRSPSGARQPAGPGPARRPSRPESGTRGIDARARRCQSLLSGQFDRDRRSGPPPTRPPKTRGRPGSSPNRSPRTRPDTSAVMPGGAQLSSVESRHRAFHRGVAHIGRQAASALAHAHARGIVHRDIKPSNLLLDTEGVVWVSDFGLAKVDDDDLTRTGDILGTLRYMAPERFRGQGDARADLYSLGLTLYELLVLRPAFDSPDRVALSEQIKTVDPPRPRSIDPRVPRDLETIVLKAIEKDPERRYASAEAMAEDLRRFLDDEPIQARRVGAPERYIRWARRNPGIAVLGGVLTAVLVGTMIASVLVAGQMAALATVNERAKLAAAAGVRAGQADRRPTASASGPSSTSMSPGSARPRRPPLAGLRHGAPLLDQCRPGPGEPDRRGWEWSYLDQWCRPELRTLSLPTEADTQAVAVSPDGRLLAVGCWTHPDFHPGAGPDVSAYLVGLPDGEIRHVLPGHQKYVYAVAFRPDGKRLATLGDERTIRIWDTVSGRELRAIRLRSPSVHRPCRCLSWSPDGRRLVCATWTTSSESGIPRPDARRPRSPIEPNPSPGVRTGPGSPPEESRDSSSVSGSGMPGRGCPLGRSLGSRFRSILSRGRRTADG